MADPRHTRPEDAAAESERRWLAETFRRGVPQLTVRAVLVGMALGAVMCLSNLYVFFKTGWSMGVTITAAILAFAVMRLFSALRSPSSPASSGFVTRHGRTPRWTRRRLTRSSTERRPRRSSPPRSSTSRPTAARGS
jgi:hypothetical protein